MFLSWKLSDACKKYQYILPKPSRSNENRKILEDIKNVLPYSDQSESVNAAENRNTATEITRTCSEQPKENHGPSTPNPLKGEDRGFLLFIITHGKQLASKIPNLSETDALKTFKMLWSKMTPENQSWYKNNEDVIRTASRHQHENIRDKLSGFGFTPESIAKQVVDDRHTYDVVPLPESLDNLGLPPQSVALQETRRVQTDNAELTPSPLLDPGSIPTTETSQLVTKKRVASDVITDGLDVSPMPTNGYIASQFATDERSIPRIITDERSIPRIITDERSTPRIITDGHGVFQSVSHGRIISQRIDGSKNVADWRKASRTFKDRSVVPQMMTDGRYACFPETLRDMRLTPQRGVSDGERDGYTHISKVYKRQRLGYYPTKSKVYQIPRPFKNNSSVPHLVYNPVIDDYPARSARNNTGFKDPCNLNYVDECNRAVNNMIADIAPPDMDASVPEESIHHTNNREAQMTGLERTLDITHYKSNNNETTEYANKHIKTEDNSYDMRDIVKIEVDDTAPIQQTCEQDNVLGVHADLKFEDPLVNTKVVHVDIEVKPPVGLSSYDLDNVAKQYTENDKYAGTTRINKKHNYNKVHFLANPVADEACVDIDDTRKEQRKMADNNPEANHIAAAADRDVKGTCTDQRDEHDPGAADRKVEDECKEQWKEDENDHVANPIYAADSVEEDERNNEKRQAVENDPVTNPIHAADSVEAEDPRKEQRKSDDDEIDYVMIPCDVKIARLLGWPVELLPRLSKEDIERYKGKSSKYAKKGD